MKDKFFQIIIIFYLLIIPNTVNCTLNYVPLKLDTFTLLSYSDVLHAANLNTYTSLSSINLQTFALAFWFKPTSIISAPLAKVIFTSGYTIQITVTPYGGGANIVYDTFTQYWTTTNKWFGFFIQESYTSWEKRYVYFGAGANKLFANTYTATSDVLTRILQDIYIGGDETNYCSSYLFGHVYLALNNYFPTIDYALSLLGDDISLGLWYIFNSATTITDITGNLPAITSANNPSLYTSGQLAYYDANEGSLKLTRTQYITIQGSLPNWFTLVNPSIIISFHFKLSPSMASQNIGIMSRVSGGVIIFYITINLSSVNVGTITLKIGDITLPVAYSPTGPIIADNLWHHFVLQMMAVYGSDGCLGFILIDNIDTGWIPMNVNTPYVDTSADTLYIGYDSIAAVDYDWYIKDFSIYRGGFITAPAAGCSIELGGISIWGPTASSPSTNTQTCLYCTSTTTCLNRNTGTNVVTCSLPSSLPCPAGTFLKSSVPIFCDDRCCPSPTSRTDCCDFRCSSCTGSSNTNCLGCNSGYYLNGNICDTTCPAGTFANSVGNICSPCSGGCVTCSGSATTCTSCAAGSYVNSGTCSPCSGGCVTCSSTATTCTSCSAGFYVNSGICSPCSGCPTCSGSATTCTSCNPGSYLNSGICSSCSGCATCATSATNCLSCSGGTFLSGNTCVNPCPSGTFANSATITCSACSGCATCVTSASNCLSCSPGTFLDGNTCGNSCPSGTYADSGTHTCTACIGCATCTTSATNCLSCPAGTFLNGNTCINPCPSGTFANIAINTCSACSGCATCITSASNCLSCSTGSFLNANTCGTSCPSGTYANSGTNTCIPCNGCAACAGSATTCTSCTPGFYLHTQTQTCKTYTQCHLAVSQFDTRDIYLTFNSTLYSANIPNLNNAFQLQISNLNTNDYTYNITQVSDTNITFRLNPIQNIDQNALTITIQDTAIIRDSNNEPILSTINSVTLGYCQVSTTIITGLSDSTMLATGIIITVTYLPATVSGGLGALWGAIDILQYLFYFIYLNVNLPLEFEQFLIYFKIATIPLPNIPNSWFSSMHKNSGVELPKLDAPYKFMMFEIDALFLKNGLTYVVYSIIFVIVVYMMVFVEKVFHKKTGSDRLKVVVKMLQWNFPLRYILVNITQISFAIFLQFVNFSINGPIQQASNAFAILSFISLVLFIIWTFRQTSSKLFNEDIEAFNLKYGSLIEEFVDPKSEDISFVTRNQCVIQIIRKIVFMFGFIILYYHVVVNLISIMIQSLIMIYLLKKYSPYLRTSFNLKNIVEEIIFFLMSFLLLLIQQDRIPAGNGTKAIDYILILLSCICFAYNVFFMIVDEIVGIKLLISSIREYSKKIKRKLNRKSSHNLSQVMPITANDIQDLNNIENKDNVLSARIDNNFLTEKEPNNKSLSPSSTNDLAKLLGNNSTRPEISPSSNNDNNNNNNSTPLPSLKNINSGTIKLDNDIIVIEPN